MTIKQKGKKRVKKRNSFQLIILFFSGVAVVFTLLVPKLPGSEQYDVVHEISVLQRVENPEVFSNIRLGMVQASVDLGVDLRFIAPAIDNDHQSQLDLMQRESEGGTSGFVVVPANTEKLEMFLEQEQIKSPVITIESALGEGGMCVYPDNRAVGEALAAACLEDNPKGTILLLNTLEYSEGMTECIDACKSVLVASGEKVIVKKATVEEISTGGATLWKEDFAQVTTVICFEPAATEAVAQYVQTNELAPSIYSVGSTAEIVVYLEKGMVEAVIAWSDYAVGYLSIQAAIQAVTGGVPVEIAPIKFNVVRGEDIYEPEHQKLLFPVTY